MAAAGVMVPEPLWLCEDTRIIGQPFIVMRRLTGYTAARTLVADAARDGFGPALAGRLAREMALVRRVALEPVEPCRKDA